MNNLINISDTHVSINDYPLQVVEYKGERVVSSYDIAKLHNKPVRTVNQQFERHKDKLKEGVDYFLINKEEFVATKFQIRVVTSLNVFSPSEATSS